MAILPSTLFFRSRKYRRLPDITGKAAVAFVNQLLLRWWSVGPCSLNDDLLPLLIFCWFSRESALWNRTRRFPACSSSFFTGATDEVTLVTRAAEFLYVRFYTQCALSKIMKFWINIRAIL